MGARLVPGGVVLVEPQPDNRVGDLKTVVWLQQLHLSQWVPIAVSVLATKSYHSICLQRGVRHMIMYCLHNYRSVHTKLDRLCARRLQCGWIAWNLPYGLEAQNREIMWISLAWRRGHSLGNYYVAESGACFL